MKINNTEINIVCRDSHNASTIGYDCIVFDPPYNDVDEYDYIPEVKKNSVLFVWGNNYNVDIVFRKTKWPYCFSIVWDGVSSWHIPGRPLNRSNICHVFGDRKYKEKKAIVYDSKYRKQRKTSNKKGQYISSEKFSS